MGQFVIQWLELEHPAAADPIVGIVDLNCWIMD
jgi:hypothetical protein